MVRWSVTVQALSSEPARCRFRGGSFPRPGPLGPDSAAGCKRRPSPTTGSSQICVRLEKHS
ncbi:hypothetical protein PspLS_07416 [Pyricularia sp. CBS 133598]|nr:hypothetical protein PspLS_07416 [Pyricularia sp. CBS 133598]